MLYKYDRSKQTTLDVNQNLTNHNRVKLTSLHWDQHLCHEEFCEGSEYIHPLYESKTLPQDSHFYGLFQAKYGNSFIFLYNFTPKLLLLLLGHFL